MVIFDTIKIFIINIVLAITTLMPQSTISIGVVDEPRSFLPHEVQVSGEQMVSNLVFRKLFKYRDGELINDLVDSWSSSDDKTTYDIKLRENIYWQDGTPITSNDVIYTLTMNQSLRDEVEIEKVSEKEIKISLQTPNAILPSLLTFGIEPAHIPNQNQLSPIGSTSYRVARVMMERGRLQGVILQSFQEGKQYNKVYFYFYRTDNDLRTAYKLGEISAFFSNTEFSYPNLTSQPVTFIGRYFTLIFNTNSQQLSTPEVREVLSTSLNTEDLIKQNYFRNSLAAQGPLSYSQYTKESFKTSQYNAEANFTLTQRALFDEELVILLPNNQDGRQIESFLNSNWGDKLDLDLEIQYYDIGDLVDRGKSGEFDIIFVGHEVTPDPDRYTFWHSTQIRNLNLANFVDLRADKALEEGRQVFEYDERMTHYNIFQDVIETKIPAVFLYHPGAYLYTSEKTPIPLPRAVYTPSDILENL